MALNIRPTNHGGQVRIEEMTHKTQGAKLIFRGVLSSLLLAISIFTLVLPGAVHADGKDGKGDANKGKQHIDFIVGHVQTTPDKHGKDSSGKQDGGKQDSGQHGQHR
jgi:hypothetical protein